MNTAIRIKDDNLVDLVASCTPHEGVREFLRKYPNLIGELSLFGQIEQCISNVGRIDLCKKGQKGMDLVDGTEVKFGTVGRYVDKKGVTSYTVSIANLTSKRGDIRVVVQNPYDSSGRQMYYFYIPNECLRLYKDGSIQITVQYDKYNNEFDITDRYKIFQVHGFADICLPVEVSRRNFKSNKILVERSIENREREVIEVEQSSLNFYERNKTYIIDAMKNGLIKPFVQNGDLDSLNRFCPKEFLMIIIEECCDHEDKEQTQELVRKISKIRSTSTVSTRISSNWNYHKRRALAAAA